MEATSNHAIATTVSLPSRYRLAPMLDMKTIPAAAPGRQRLEDYIATVFHDCHGARVYHYMPLLCSLERADIPTAALGLHGASQGPLFCESYLDIPVEKHVQRLYGECCSRGEIVELGNLVSSRAGDSALLYLLVTAALHKAGVRYLLFAANRAVRASIRRSRYTPQIIGPADSSRLGKDQEQWGKYYDGDPQVMLGDMQLTYQQSMAQPKMVRELEHYELAVERLSAEISKLVA